MGMSLCKFVSEQLEFYATVWSQKDSRGGLMKDGLFFDILSHDRYNPNRRVEKSNTELIDLDDAANFRTLS